MRYSFGLWGACGALVVGGAIGIPAHAASFDCTKATTAVEKKICQNGALSRLDDRMAETYRSVASARPNDATLRSDQAVWLQRRNRCADESCLAAVYTERISALAAISEKPVGTDSDLLKSVEALNDKCRGGSGDDPATQAACVKREAVVAELKARGWCWGKLDQPEYQKSWQYCRGNQPVAQTPLATCINAIEPYARANAMAYVASICSLRSQQYFVTIRNAMYTVGNSPICRAVAKAEVDAELTRIFADEVAKVGLRNNDASSLGPACQRLASNPGLLRELDAKHRGSTLGYR